MFCFLFGQIKKKTSNAWKQRVRQLPVRATAVEVAARSAVQQARATLASQLRTTLNLSVAGHVNMNFQRFSDVCVDVSMPQT